MASKSVNGRLFPLGFCSVFFFLLVPTVFLIGAVFGVFAFRRRGIGLRELVYRVRPPAKHPQMFQEEKPFAYHNRLWHVVRDCFSARFIVGILLIAANILWVWLAADGYDGEDYFVDRVSLFAPLSAVFLFTTVADIERLYGMEEMATVQKKSNAAAFWIRFGFAAVLEMMGLFLTELACQYMGLMPGIFLFDSNRGVLYSYLTGFACTMLVAVACAIISILADSPKNDFILGLGFYLFFLYTTYSIRIFMGKWKIKSHGYYMWQYMGFMVLGLAVLGILVWRRDGHGDHV